MFWRHKNFDFALRSDDPAPGGSNTHEGDLRFDGTLVVEVEDVWNDAETVGTFLDGLIFNRLAIYKRVGKNSLWRRRNRPTFIAEQCRYNKRNFFNPRNASSAVPIPFFSRAVEFDSFQKAVDWIETGLLISDSNLKDKFMSEVVQLNAGAWAPPGGRVEADADKLRAFVRDYTSYGEPHAQIVVDDKNREFRAGVIRHVMEDLETTSTELIRDLVYQEAKWSMGRDIDNGAFAILMSELIARGDPSGVQLLLHACCRNQDLDGTLTGGLRLTEKHRDELLAQIEAGFTRRLSIVKNMVERASIRPVSSIEQPKNPKSHLDG